MVKHGEKRMMVTPQLSAGLSLSMIVEIFSLEMVIGLEYINPQITVKIGVG
jgi:hypothetical protein